MGLREMALGASADAENQSHPPHVPACEVYECMQPGRRLSLRNDAVWIDGAQKKGKWLDGNEKDDFRYSLR